MLRRPQRQQSKAYNKDKRMKRVITTYFRAESSEIKQSKQTTFYSIIFKVLDWNCKTEQRLSTS